MNTKKKRATVSKVKKTESVKVRADLLQKIRDYPVKNKGRVVIQWFVEEAIEEKLKREENKE